MRILIITLTILAVCFWNIQVSNGLNNPVKLCTQGRFISNPMKYYLQFTQFNFDYLVSGRSNESGPNFLVDKNGNKINMILKEFNAADSTTGGGLKSALEAQMDGCDGFVGGGGLATQQAASYVAAAYQIPHIVSLSTSTALNTRTNYPYMMRTVPSDLYLCRIVTSYVNSFGWKHVVALYGADDTGSTTIAQFQLEAARKNLTVYPIQVPVGNTNWNKTIAQIQATNVRVVSLLIAGSDGYNYLKSMNNSGLLTKEMVIILSNSLYSLWGTSYPGEANLRLRQGTVGLLAVGPSGRFASELQAEFTVANQTRWPYSGPIRSYVDGAGYYLVEAAAVFAHAVDVLLKQGYNVSQINGSTLLSTMKSNRYVGTTGNVFFDKDGERYTDYYAYANTYTGDYPMAKFDAVTEEFTLTDKPLYIGGGYDKPIDKPCIPDCGAHGQCINYQCVCSNGYVGTGCDVSYIVDGGSSGMAPKNLALAIVFPVIAVIAVTIVVAQFLVRRKRRLLVQDLQKQQRSIIKREDINMKKFIGRGASGDVYAGDFRGTKVACKILQTTNSSANELAAIELESALMCGLRHPNIVLFMGSCIDKKNNQVILVMEYMSQGSLNEVLKNKSIDLPLRIKLQIAYQAAQGINFLHQSSPPIIHCDIKSHNVFLDDKWYARVGDFGISKINEISNKGSAQPGQAMGTLFWTAPEVLEGSDHTSASDCYSFGILLWEIFHRKEPYAGRDPLHVALDVVKTGNRPPIDPDVPKSVASLINACWEQDYKLRPSTQEISDKLQDLLSAETGDLVGTTELAPAGIVYFVAFEIESFFDLWDQLPASCYHILESYQAMMKGLITKYNGYEAAYTYGRYEGESRVEKSLIAFNAADAAANFALSVQTDLLTLHWPVDFEKNTNTSTMRSADTGKVLWCGFRLKMAMNKGQPHSQTNDRRKIQYSGPVVDATMKLLEHSVGGVILITESISQTLKPMKIAYEQQSFADVAYTNDKMPSKAYIIAPEGMNERLNDASLGHGLLTTPSTPDPHVILDMDVFELNSSKPRTPKKGPAWLITSGAIASNDNDLVRSKVATVTKGKYKSEDVAIKTFYGQSSRIGDVYYVGSVSTKVHHTNVVKCYGVTLSADNQFSIVYEYMEKGSLENLLHNTNTPINNAEKMRWSRDIAVGMNYLCSFNDPLISSHKNLKSSNILVTANKQVKVGDYGMNYLYEDMRTLTSIGQVQWTAPELFSGQPHTTLSAIYSYGIILYEIWARKTPYNLTTHPIKLLHQIQFGLRPSLPDNMPKPIAELMQRCWSGDVHARPYWETIIATLDSMNI